MKLLKNKICRKRYRTQIKIRKWVNVGGWGWNVGKVNPKKEEDPKAKKTFR